MHPFDDGVGLGSFDCCCYVGNSHVLEELLEGRSNEFVSVIVNASEWTRISFQLEVENFFADMRRGFITKTACIAEACKRINTRQC